MLKIKKWLEILENSSQYLFLASGEKNGEGYWIVGIKNCDENIFEDKNKWNVLPDGYLISKKTEK